MALHFADNWRELPDRKRVFDVFIEGEVRLKEVDDCRDAGGFNAAYKQSIEDVAVEDGVLDLEFRRGIQQPFICGIEVLRLGP